MNKIDKIYIILMRHVTGLWSLKNIGWNKSLIEKKLPRIVVQKCIFLYDAKYNTIQYNAMQYNTIQYNTIQYNTKSIYAPFPKDSERLQRNLNTIT